MGPEYLVLFFIWAYEIILKYYNIQNVSCKKQSFL